MRSVAMKVVRAGSVWLMMLGVVCIAQARVYKSATYIFDEKVNRFQPGDRCEMPVAPVRGTLSAHKTTFNNIDQSMVFYVGYSREGADLKNGDLDLIGCVATKVTTDAVVTKLEDTSIKSLTVKAQKKDFSGNYWTPLVYVARSSVEHAITFEDAPGYVVVAEKSGAPKIVNGSVVSAEKALKQILRLERITEMFHAWEAVINSGDVQAVETGIAHKTLNPNIYLPVLLITPLFYAAIEGKSGLVELLLKHGSDKRFKQEPGSYLAVVIDQGDYDEVIKLFLAHGVPVDVRIGAEQITPLMWAALKGREKVVKALLDAGADILAELEESGETVCDLPQCKDNPQIRGMLFDAQQKKNK